MWVDVVVVLFVVGLKRTVWVGGQGSRFCFDDASV